MKMLSYSLDPGLTLALCWFALTLFKVQPKENAILRVNTMFKMSNFSKYYLHVNKTANILKAYLALKCSIALFAESRSQ